MEAARFVVEVRDPKGLAATTFFAEAAGKEFTCRPKTVELQREFGTLIPHGLAVAGSQTANDVNRVGIEG